MTEKDLEKRELEIKLKMLDAIETMVDETIKATKTLGKIVQDDFDEQSRIEAARVLLSKIFADKKDDGKTAGMQPADFSFLEDLISQMKSNS